MLPSADAARQKKGATGRGYSARFRQNPYNGLVRKRYVYPLPNCALRQPILFFSRQRPAAAFLSLGMLPCAGAETLILKNRTVNWEIYSKPIESCRTKKYRNPLKDCGMYENIYCSDLGGMKPVPLCGICSMAFPFRGRQFSIVACPPCGRQCIDYKA